MDQTMEHQKLQALSQFSASQFLKKATQLLLSLSVFSFFFSHSTWLSFLLHSLNFSSLPVQILTHAISRNYIFLLCNGILVFLARNSGFISSSSSGFDHADEYFFRKSGDGLPSSLDKEAMVETIRPTGSADVEEERGVQTEILIVQVAVENETLVAEDENPEESSPETGLRIEEEEEEEEEEDDDDDDDEGNSSLSTEELNKKFDDFIRRMKEEIRIGSMATDHSLVVRESFT